MYSKGTTKSYCPLYEPQLSVKEAYAVPLDVMFMSLP